MHAALITRPGQPPSPVDRDEPVPQPDQVVVDVLAAPITPLDLLCATGTSYFGVPATPYVPGVQGIGTVDGRAVWFPTRAGMAAGDGSMAAKAVVRKEDLVFLPDGVKPVAIAALGLSAVAAHMALTWRGELTPGECVIVLGVGAVGQAAIQLARLAGAGRVVAAARSETGRQRAVRAGADAVVSLETDHLAMQFLETAPGADLLLDPLFGAPAAAAAQALRPGGRWVNLGGSAGETCSITSSTLRSRSLRLSGYTNNELTAQQRAEAISTVARHAARGELVVDHEVVPLCDVTDAWHRTRHGRVVLIP
ncbi:zinc-binding alcohol dehydrogenase family protein [Lentzea sp. BCCO 10_0856]|uniref:Zinc-binding alcohol dehydrogenase family protein n=1 Tax=Lentzea miocenica TaxID=3095431 RepID=A0ABU4T576_9PSEU|nr:zinc-binding alcohol dehydrogenase family protein [Lentzea sp. BCCO 10_0856]MDX8033307.1 zinc-binding alcohol dehydrogenase family protein [Lentzea sp. BCCO 10_0856]